MSTDAPSFRRGTVFTVLLKSAFQSKIYIYSYHSRNHRRQSVGGGAALLKQILSEFLKNNGVTTAALVGRDGFVIDVATKASLDPDALGALGSSSINFFENRITRIENSKLRQMTLEYLNGAIILTPVSREEFLMILTDTTVGLGVLSHRIAHTSLRVAAAI